MSALLCDQQPVVEEGHTPEQPRASDEELLRRFVADRSDPAFAQMVTRHASLVMSVCRRVLGKEQDAEDAFQATFLVLARKATSLRGTKSLPAWLHKTAHRIALRARAATARRRERPLEAETMIATETLSRIASDYDLSVLDTELSRLPDQYRFPLFLCCVEGLSRDEAALRLGWSAGSLKGRLERGRQLLRRRLMLRGVSLGIGLAAVIRAYQTAQAAVAPPLVASTVQAGVHYAAGQTVLESVSPKAILLANGSFHVMSLTTLRFALCSLMVVGLLAGGASVLPAPAIAGRNDVEGLVLVSQAAASDSFDSEAAVAFAANEEGRRRRRSPEGERDARSDAVGVLPGRFVHVGLYTLKSDAPEGTAAAFVKDAVACFREIPHIRAFRIGPPATPATPKAYGVTPREDYHIGSLLCFDGYEGLAKYGNHPRLIALKQKYDKYFEKVVAYDFEQQ